MEQVQLDPRTQLASVRSHMANERTHLAYLRTAISLISFGITLNRFSVNLHFKNTEHVGLGMVITGIMIVMWSHRRFETVRVAIETNSYVSTHKSISVFTIGVLILGGLMTMWMFFSQS